VIDQEEEKEIKALVLPQLEGALLLPNTTVVEVVSLDVVKQKKAVNWLLGTVKWRNLDISVVSFEKMKDASVDDNSVRSRIAICHSFSEDDNNQNSFVGINMQGIPKLLLVNESVISQVLPIDEDEMRPLVTHVVVSNQKLSIPDMDKLRERLIKVTP